MQFYLLSFSIMFSSIMYIIHIVAYISTSFLSVAEQYSILYIYPILFIHSSTDEYLGCLHPLAIVNSAAMNKYVHVFVGVLIFNSLGYTARCGIVESYDNSMFNLLRNCQTFSTVAAHFTFLPAIYECSNYTTSLPPTLKFHFYYSHPSEYEMVSYSSFDLYFPND